MDLRPYQQEAVDALYAWFEAKPGNPLVVVPTGGGKSVILAAFVRSVLTQWPGERILCITHVRELIAQNHAAMLRHWPEAPAGIYSAGIGRREHDAHLLFAGVQSVYTKAAKIGWADLVIVDEAHLVPKKGQGMYRQLLADLSSMNPRLRVIGLTATPFRTDSGRLDRGEDRMFHGVAYTCDLAGMIKDGWLSPVTCRGSKDATIHTDGVHIQAGEFVADELQRAAMADGIVQRACAEIVARAKERKAWLVFGCGVAHARAIAAELTRLGVPGVETVFGETKPAERDRVIREFRAGKVRAIVNVGVLTTGFDAPHVDLIAVLRPTFSPGLYVQMVGRGLRRAEGKVDCLVLDFGENVIRHGPLDRVRSRKEPSGDQELDEDETDDDAGKQCPNCDLLIERDAKVCPECGFEFAVLDQEKPRHEPKPDEHSFLVMGLHPTGGIEHWPVLRTQYLPHHKIGKPLSMKVEYQCSEGFHPKAIREWVCFEHEGFARTKAVQWWRKSGGRDPVPTLVYDALQRTHELRVPAEVVVDVRGEFPKLLSVRLTDEVPF